MKKVCLVLFLLFAAGFGSYCYSQSTTSNLGAGGVENWLDGKSWDNGPPADGYTVTISSNETIYINKKVEIVGDPVHVVVYGVLEFRTGGKLILPTGSTIEVKEGGDVAANAGNESQLLQIGDSTLKADEIDAITGPALVDETYITTLPINLLYFTATEQATAIELNWAASKAWDFSHYELQRSRNGKDFEWVTTIDAEENTDYTTEFSYTDRQPHSGTSFYRLKAVDIDGKYEYKGMEVVQFMGKNFEVYPNPVTNGNFKVNALQATEGVQLILRDQTGRMVRSHSMSEQEENISTQGLPAGLYILLIQTSQQTTQSQLLIH